MSLLINLQDIEEHDVNMEGDTGADDLEFEVNDAAISITQSLKYKLSAAIVSDALLIRGNLHLELNCKCVRCMTTFAYPIDFQDWICHIPISGEGKAPINMGCVDLTPYIREDMLLAFPQHPLCREDCSGLLAKDSKKSEDPSDNDDSSSPWDQLKQLKL